MKCNIRDIRNFYLAFKINARHNLANDSGTGAAFLDMTCINNDSVSTKHMINGMILILV